MNNKNNLIRKSSKIYLQVLSIFYSFSFLFAAIFGIFFDELFNKPVLLVIGFFSILSLITLFKNFRYSGFIYLGSLLVCTVLEMLVKRETPSFGTLLIIGLIFLLFWLLKVDDFWDLRYELSERKHYFVISMLILLNVSSLYMTNYRSFEHLLSFNNLGIMTPIMHIPIIGFVLYLCLTFSTITIIILWLSLYLMPITSGIVALVFRLLGFNGSSTGFLGEFTNAANFVDRYWNDKMVVTNYWNETTKRTRYYRNGDWDVSYSKPELKSHTSLERNNGFMESAIHSSQMGVLKMMFTLIYFLLIFMFSIPIMTIFIMYTLYYQRFVLKK